MFSQYFSNAARKLIWSKAIYYYEYHSKKVTVQNKFIVKNSSLCFWTNKVFWQLNMKDVMTGTAHTQEQIMTRGQLQARIFEGCYILQATALWNVDKSLVTFSHLGVSKHVLDIYYVQSPRLDTSQNVCMIINCSISCFFIYCYAKYRPLS